MPNSCPRLEARVLRPARRDGRKQGGIGGVLERADHTRDILQRRMFEPSFVERTRGFPFKIKNIEVPLGPEHLAEVVIAMDANLRGDKLERRRAPNSFEQRIAGLQ